MDEQAGWTAHGLHWHGGRPYLSARCGERGYERALVAGERVGWVLAGPRRCTGVWLPGEPERRPCPHRATIDPDGAAVQCPACQAADRGLALARDQIVDDGRTYRLYLAWLGAGLLKVGLTAEERGNSRLLEQGALAFTFLARGSLPGIRRAELTVSGARLARERYRSQAKLAGWWGLPTAAARAAELAGLRTRALPLLAGHRIELHPQGEILDHVELFGLGAGAPREYLAVAGLADGAVVGGVARAPIGRHVFLDQPAGPPVLLDTRKLAGWRITSSTGSTADDTPTPNPGLRLQRCTEPVGSQEALF
ncbi:DUF2797 domain-containing protein [Streptomyces tateyamensis]|uniref:DUF2797 domain-containing protein n=1 Tax=Streptomyces tateyamensis TaxID=565073 RepID=A0A2V4PRN4_9ACTN|nr:DUF2797 domain-containing protein [Streptomyces tateyamensis]PYC87635.1 DUF2797 domain-containing protein [Streptomyces tateyamensis]